MSFERRSTSLKEPATLEKKNISMNVSKSALSSGGKAGTKENKILKRKPNGSKCPSVGIAQKKLVLKPINKKSEDKKAVEPTVRPSPFVLKTNMYDEHWIKKQERGFTKWLNFVLSPTDELGNVLSTQGKSVTKIELLDFEDGNVSQSVSTLPLHLLSKRRLLRWRQSLYYLFQSEPYTHVISKLEIEVETGRIVVHKDRRPHSDIGARQKLLDILLSYNPVWLRLGLEAVFGELIEISENQSLQQVLLVYVQSRFLCNKQIAERYSHPTLKGQFGEGYVEAQSQYLLKKFLYIVLLLDKAKLTHVIDHDPCLFRKHALIKSSQDMLYAFSSNFLFGEGNFVKHLQLLGFSVSHAQTHLGEFEYFVNNLAVDLQDGIRLTRLVEIFTENWKLSGQLRVPATTKMQKLHNVGIALEALCERVPLPGGTTAQGIVEGHREKTLGLLWTMIFHFQVKLNLNIAELESEITLLSKMRPHPIASAHCNPQSSSLEQPNGLFFKSPELSVMLQWCKEVGRLYGVPVNNFSNSFSDGRILCYLLYHYQPGLLPLNLINNETTFTTSTSPRADPVEEQSDKGWVASFSPTTGRDREKEKLLANEKANYKLLSQKLPLLGGVPLMLLSRDMSNTLPDEKVVITLVSYLCHQLLLLKRETNAAVTIQRSWRNHMARKKKKELLIEEAILRNMHASIIQATYKCYVQRRRYIIMKHSAYVIQYRWRSLQQARKTKLAYLELKHATKVLQSHVRRRKVQQMLETQNRAAVAIQAMFRQYRVRSRYLSLKSSTITIQCYWRATLQARRIRNTFIGLKWAATTLQSHVRKWLVQKALSQQHKSATVLQSAYRSYSLRKRYMALRHSTSVIQLHWRATILVRHCRSAYLKQRRAAIVLQAHTRRRQVQKRLAIRHRAAAKIQATYKCHVQRKRYCILQHSASLIQYYWRATLLARRDRRAYLNLRSAAIILQSHVRRQLVQKVITHQHMAATTIQAMYKCHVQQKKYLELKRSVKVLECYRLATTNARQCRTLYLKKRKAAIVLQANVRRRNVQKMIARQHVSAKKIQAMFRSHLHRKHYLAVKRSVQVIECYWGATLLARQCRAVYLKQRNTLVVMQSHVRRWLVQKMISNQHRSATVVQSAYRGYSQRKRYLAMKHAMNTIELYWKTTLLARQCRSKYLKLRRAAIVLQAHMRRRQVQKRLAIQHRAAAIIQATYRCYAQHQHYCQLKHSVEVIECYWNATLLARAQRASYIEVRQAIIVLQSHVRRMRVQKRIAHQHKSASIIQAMYRCYWNRKQFLLRKRSITVLQCYWRATLLARQCRVSYLRLKTSTIILQAHVRRRKVQKRLAIQHRAATVIQSMFRCYIEKRHFTKIRGSLVVIQCRWRATLLARQCRRSYTELRRAATTLQSHFRRRKVQQMLGIQHRAATTIQSVFRGCLCRRQYQALKQSATVIQCRWRATLVSRDCRMSYLTMRRAVILLQSHCRRRKVQQMLIQQHRAATTIQSVFRGYLCRRRYQALKQSATVIQCRWRATLVSRECRMSYLTMRRAVILLQSHCRRRKVQQMLIRQHRAATTIQSVFRGHSQRRHYSSLKQSTSIIQSHWRATLMGREYRSSYLDLRQAAIIIQSHTRRRNVQKALAYQHQQATVIQSVVRSRLQRQQYLKLKQAVCVIQSYWKYTLLARQHRGCYLEVKWAAITLQSHTRRWLVQRYIAHMHSSATILQSIVRCFIQKQRYCLLKHSTIVIQQYWRSYLIASTERKKYTFFKLSTILFQANSRRWLLQRSLAHQHKAATVIQTAVRCHIQRKQYIRYKCSVVLIQYQWRATLLARQCRAVYLKQRQALIVMQSHVRRWLVQKMISNQHRSATVVQSAYRGYSQRKRYLAMKHAVNTIELYWKTTLLARQCRSEYLQLRRAAIVLQAHMRRRQVQKRLAIQHRAAAIIQATYRCYAQHQHYCQLKHSVEVIECYWNATLLARAQRASYIQLKKATVIMQACIRRKQAQKMIALLNSSATRIQAMFKCHQQRRHYLSMKQSVCVIVCHWRATLRARQCRRSYLELKHAAIVLQSHVRRMRVQKRIAHQHKSASIIQAMYWCYWNRKQFLLRKRSITVLQCYWRATLLARQCRVSYLRLKTSTIILQAHVRRRKVQNMVKQQHKAATVIQSLFRCYIEKRRFTKIRGSLVVIQCRWRATLLARQCRRSYTELRRAATTLQSHFRRRKVQQMLGIQHRAATTIQSVFRGYLCKRQYQALKQSATVIQCRWRATLVSRDCRMSYLTMRRAVILLQSHCRRRKVQQMLIQHHRAATTIQSVFRGHSQRRHYSSLKQSASIIQSHWRATLMGRECRSSYLDLRQAAIIIQSHTRRWLAQRYMAQMHSSATILQAIVRCFIQKQRYCLLKHSIIVIQQYWRSYLIASTERKKYTLFKLSTILFQANSRRWLLQRSLAHQHKAATVIQAAVRCHFQRRCYLQYKHSVSLIQYWWRATVMRNEQRRYYLKLRSSVILLQSHVRRRIVERYFSRLNNAATVIQSKFKAAVARRRYLKLKSAVIMVQRVQKAKGVVRRLREEKRLNEMTRAAIIIQLHWRRYQEAHSYERKIKHCATKIQSLWRGYRVRRQIKNKAIAEARRRICRANRAAKDCNTLRNRLPSMLDALLRSKYLSTVVDILRSFELMTSVSERCSAVIVEGNALPVLYDYIERSNRSRATLEVVKVCLQILINVMKWASTRSTVLADTGAVSSLVDFMQKVYVTQPDIMLLATVLVHSYRKTHNDKVFHDSCRRKITSMHSVLERKIKMSTNQRRAVNQSYQLCLQYLKEILL